MNNENNEFSVSSDSVVNNIPIIENDVVPSKKKKGGKVVLISLLAILLLAGAVVGGFFLGKEYANKEEKVEDKVEKVDKEENKESTEDDKDETKEPVEEIKKNDKYTFVKEYKTLITLNGKQYDLITYYYVDYEREELGPAVYTEDEYKNVYVTRADIFLNNKEIVSENIVHLSYDKKESDKFVNIMPKYNTSILEDSVSDEEYLLLFLNGYSNSKNLDYNEITLYVVSKDVGQLKMFSTINYTGLSYIIGDKTTIRDHNYVPASEYYKYIDPYYVDDGELDGEYVLYSNGLVDVHDDFLYYAVASEGCYTANEYKVVIKNGDVIETKVASYNEDQTVGAGQC